MDLWEQEKCSTEDIGTCVWLGNHGVVEKHKSNEYECASWQSHEVEA